MRRDVLAGFLSLGLATGPAAAACPPELLQQMLEQGYTREDVLRICGSQDGSTAGDGPSARVNDAFSRLRALTAELDRKCRSTPGSNARGTGSCDLSREYRGIMAQWERGQQKCSGGDASACEVLEEAAGQFFDGLSRP